MAATAASACGWSTWSVWAPTEAAGAKGSSSWRSTSMSERSAVPSLAIQADVISESACMHRPNVAVAQSSIEPSLVSQVATLEIMSQVKDSTPSDDGGWQSNGSEAISMPSRKDTVPSVCKLDADTDQYDAAPEVASSLGGNRSTGNGRSNMGDMPNEAEHCQDSTPRVVECSTFDESTNIRSANGHVNNISASVEETCEPIGGGVRTSVIQVLEGWREADANLAEIEVEIAERGTLDDIAGSALLVNGAASISAHGAVDDTTDQGAGDDVCAPDVWEAMKVPAAPVVPSAPEAPEALEAARVSASVEGAISAAAFDVWLSKVDPSGALAVYHQMLMDSYDTVDQISRLYVSPEAPDVLSAEFFSDIGAVDPSHRQLFSDWFASQAPLNPAPEHSLLEGVAPGSPSKPVHEPAIEFACEPVGDPLCDYPGPAELPAKFDGNASREALGNFDIDPSGCVFGKPLDLDRYNVAKGSEVAHNSENWPAAAGDRSATPSASCWGPLSFLWGGRRRDRSARARSEPAMRTPLRSKELPTMAMLAVDMPPVSSLMEATDDLLGPLEFSDCALNLQPLNGGPAQVPKQKQEGWRWSQSHGRQS